MSVGVVAGAAAVVGACSSFVSATLTLTADANVRCCQVSGRPSTSLSSSNAGPG